MDHDPGCDFLGDSVEDPLACNVSGNRQLLHVQAA